MLNVTQDLASQSDSFRQFEGGVKLGIGSFNLVGFHRGLFYYAITLAIAVAHCCERGISGTP